VCSLRLQCSLADGGPVPIHDDSTFLLCVETVELTWSLPLIPFAVPNQYRPSATGLRSKRAH
jgi:hypothetical protein